MNKYISKLLSEIVKDDIQNNRNVLANEIFRVIQSSENDQQKGGAIVNKELIKDVLRMAMRINADNDTMVNFCNQAIKELLKPDYHTYNGESAEEFFLCDDDSILVWSGVWWNDIDFRYLRRGDRWMFQPPPPKEESK